MDHNYEWFSQWIWGETAPASSSAAASATGGAPR
jgi:hypothetical protein